MNFIARLRAGLAGPSPSVLAPAQDSITEAIGLLRYCPECGSENASEVTERDRRATRLTCPDCGLTQKTELLR